MAGEFPPTAPPTGIAGAGVTVLPVASRATRRIDSAQAPPGRIREKMQESTCVFEMINLLVRNLDKEIMGIGVEETDARHKMGVDDVQIEDETKAKEKGRGGADTVEER